MAVSSVVVGPGASEMGGAIAGPADVDEIGAEPAPRVVFTVDGIVGFQFASASGAFICAMALNISVSAHSRSSTFMSSGIVKSVESYFERSKRPKAAASAIMVRKGFKKSIKGLTVDSVRVGTWSRAGSWRLARKGIGGGGFRLGLTVCGIDYCVV